MTPPDQMGAASHLETGAASARKTLIVANDKSSGKTTTANAVLVICSAAEAVIGWGPRTRVFLVEQEYLGRLSGATPVWAPWKERLPRREGGRVSVLRIEKLAVADIGRVVFQRIDRMVAYAQHRLRDTDLQGAEYIRAIRQARAEIAWGDRTLDAVRPISKWFAS